MSTGVIVAITIAVLVIVITLLVLGLAARRRRQTRTTIGLPDLGAVTGEDPHQDDHAEANGTPLRKSEQRH